MFKTMIEENSKNGRECVYTRERETSMPIGYGSGSEEGADQNQIEEEFSST